MTPREASVKVAKGLVRQWDRAKSFNADGHITVQSLEALDTAIATALDQ